MSNANFKYIGKHRRAVEHRRFVVGEGNFAADIHLRGMLHVAILASPYAHAKIKSIDVSAALAMPGVHTVITGADLFSDTDPVLPGVDAPLV